MNLDTNSLLIIFGIVALLLVAFLLLRPKRRSDRIERGGGEPYVASQERPYMKAKVQDGPQGNSLADEIATATTDVAGDVLGTRATSELPGAGGIADDLTRLKGVGQKFAARLNELGISRYEQLAGFGENELSALDEKLGPFRGRLTRDRVSEQAHYLARGDTDGFEEKFGKLSS
jgi:predicted flap endonuclease-1-like 5' DNA nuclease